MEEAETTEVVSIVVPAGTVVVLPGVRMAEETEDAMEEETSLTTLVVEGAAEVDGVVAGTVLMVRLIEEVGDCEKDEVAPVEFVDMTSRQRIPLSRVIVSKNDKMKSPET